MRRFSKEGMHVEKACRELTQSHSDDNRALGKISRSN